MNKIFIEYGAKLIKPERPYVHGLQITLEYYLDGYDMTVLDNYEGGPRFEIEHGREKDVEAFIREFVEAGHVIVPWQIQRVRAFEIRQDAPRNRYTTVVAYEGEPAATVSHETTGESNEWTNEPQQGSSVREDDPQLPLEPTEPGGSEPGSIGI